MVIELTENFLGASEKICLPEIAVFSVLGPLQNPLSASLFVKTRNFSFLVDRILQKCRMSILKLHKYSFESEEHSKCLQSMSEVSRKDFQTHFQKSYFIEKAFFFRQKYAKRV